LDLLPVDNINELLRKIFFSFPDYRKYLLAIVTENITKNGLEGPISNIETILINNLFDQVENINQIIDDIEKLINIEKLSGENILKLSSSTEVISAFKKFHQINFPDNDFESWNKELLGVSGDKQSIFHAVIAKGALNAKDKYVFNIRDNQEEY
jgi:hypothetical protein